MNGRWMGDGRREMKYLPLVNIIGIPWLVLLVGGRHVEFCGGGGGGVRASKKFRRKEETDQMRRRRNEWVPYRT
jgi:hypothetical protein